MSVLMDLGRAVRAAHWPSRLAAGWGLGTSSCPRPGAVPPPSVPLRPLQDAVNPDAHFTMPPSHPCIFKTTLPRCFPVLTAFARALSLHREAHAPAARRDSGLPRATLLARAGQGTLASLCRRKMPGATRLLSAMWVLKGDASCFLAIHSRVWQLPPVL